MYTCVPCFVYEIFFYNKFKVYVHCSVKYIVCVESLNIYYVIFSIKMSCFVWFGFC